MKKIFSLLIALALAVFGSLVSVAAEEEVASKVNFASGITDIRLTGFYTSATTNKAQLTDGETTHETDVTNKIGDATTLILNLGAVRDINEICVYDEYAKTKHATLRAYVSKNGIDYESVGTLIYDAEDASGIKRKRAFETKEAQYVKITNEAGKMINLMELEVWGEASYAFGIDQISLTGFYSSASTNKAGLTDGRLNDCTVYSNKTVTPEIVLNLGTIRRVDKVNIYDNLSGRTYDVYVSVGGSTYTKVGTTVLDAGNKMSRVSFASKEIQYVKFISTAAATVQIKPNEIEVWGDASTHVNHAFGKTAITFGGGYYSSANTNKALLTDGSFDFANVTSNPNATTYPYLVLDLGSVKTAGEICVHDSNKRTYTVEISENGEEYFSLGNTVASDSGSELSVISFTPQNMRYVKLTSTSLGQVRTNEIEVWEEVGDAGTAEEPVTDINHALGITDIQYSNFYTSAAEGIIRLTDGKTDNPNVSCAATSQATLTLDLGAQVTANEICIFDLYSYSGKGKATYAVSTSTDGTTYDNIGNAVAEEGWNKIYFNKKAVRYIKITTTEATAISLGEIEVWEHTAPENIMIKNFLATQDAEKNTATISFDVINNGDTAVSGNVFVAIFNGNSLVDVYKQEGRADVNGTINVPAAELNSSAGTVKAFFWDGDLKPLCPVKDCVLTVVQEEVE